MPRAKSFPWRSKNSFCFFRDLRILITLPIYSGKYTGRCELCSVTYDGEMLCDCLDGDDKTVKASIDLSMSKSQPKSFIRQKKLMILDDIISNDNGILHCYVGAGFDASCIKQFSSDDECP